MPFDPEAVDYNKCVKKKGDDAPDKDKNEDFNQKRENSDFLKKFESRLPKATLNEFWECYINNTLPQSENLRGLFEYWTDLLLDYPVENTDIVQSQAEMTVETSQSSNVDNATIEYSSQNSVIVDGNDDLCGIYEIVQNSESSVGTPDIAPLLNLDDIELDSSPRNVPSRDPTFEFDDIIPGVAPSANFGDIALDSSLENVSFENPLPKIHHAPSCPIISDTQNVFDRNTNLKVDDFAGSIIHRAKSAENIFCTPKAKGTIIERCIKSAEDIYKKPSVDEILNSITTYKTNAPKSDPENKKIRKNIILPSVITCDKWLELQRAKERAKMELDEQKQAKRKILLQKKTGERTKKECST